MVFPFNGLCHEDLEKLSVDGERKRIRMGIMPAASLPPESWRALRRDCESGAEDKSLAETYGVTTHAIKQRRYDDKKRGDPWQTPRELKVQAEVQLAKKKAERVSNKAALTNLTEPATAAQELAALKENTPLAIAKHVSSLILSAIAENLIPKPKSAKELGTLSTVFGNMVGLNRGGGGIQINLSSGMAWSQPQGPSEKPLIIVTPKEED